jgi:hypothetical protein
MAPMAEISTLVGLTKFAVICKPPAYQGHRCAGIQQRCHGDGTRVFEANGAPSLDHLWRVHYLNLYARTGVVLIKWVPGDLDSGHAMKPNRPVPWSILA